MAKKPYLPEKDAELDEWVEHFSNKLPAEGATLGIANSEINAAQNKISDYKQALDDVNAIKAKAAVGKKKLEKKAMLAIIRPMVQRMKNHPQYEESRGKLLGIVGAEEDIDLSNLQPVLKAGKRAGKPKIIWKKGQADAINIYADRKDGKGFVFLATDMTPDYVDNTPIPDGQATDIMV